MELSAFREMIDSLQLSGSSREDLFHLPTLCEVRDYSRLDIFLRQAEYPAHVGFVLDGIFREFYRDPGEPAKEYNQTFCFRGDFTGPYYDLQQELSSTVSVQAVTPGRLLLIPLKNLRQPTDTLWLQIGRGIVHRRLMQKFEREYQLLTFSAMERYDLLERSYPDLIRHVPAYHIASFLGITPISLSRLRKERAGRPS